MTQKKDAFLILRLPSELKAQLIKLSKKAGHKSLSDFIREIIEHHAQQ